MLILTDAPQKVELLTVRQRIFGTARGLILQWRDRPHLLFDVYLMGAPPFYCTPTSSREANFIRMMRHYEADHVAANPGEPPPLNAGLTDAHYGEIYEAICGYVKHVAERGKWRRRRM